MNIGYLDSSGLLAMILLEPGSTEVAARIKSFDQFFSSNLLEAEIRSALKREKVEWRWSLTGLTWVHPDRPLTREFQQVLTHGYLKGADLWHLACALFLSERVGPVTFLTLDKRQRDVAELLGFSV
jgi:predicted nucleic acid-binding protein